LQGKTVLWHTLTVFLEAYEDMEIILVLPEEHLETGRRVLAVAEAEVGSRGGLRFQDRLRGVRMVAGGATRFHSVQNGLRSIGDSSVIFVHDGVRCLLTTGLVQRCYEHTLRHGSAIPVIDARDSVRLMNGQGHEAVDRNRVKLVQTPQTFLSDILLPAYKLEYRESFTDEATVVEAAGGRVDLVEGEPFNIKITMPVDLDMAEKILESRTRGYGTEGEGAVG
jgi:2-C-methyl-D-erythritol 4-phosphate cytidylyltransferase